MVVFIEGKRLREHFMVKPHVQQDYRRFERKAWVYSLSWMRHFWERRLYSSKADLLSG